MREAAGSQVLQLLLLLLLLLLQLPQLLLLLPLWLHAVAVIAAAAGQLSHPCYSCCCVLLQSLIFSSLQDGYSDGYDDKKIDF